MTANQRKVSILAERNRLFKARHGASLHTYYKNLRLGMTHDAALSAAQDVHRAKNPILYDRAKIHQLLRAWR